MIEASWRPSASLADLRQRAAILQHIRHFFNQRGYLEVETPIMAEFGVTDVYLSNIQAQFRNQSYSLQTSPEYHMKRLLAAGSGPIFQLARVFRDDELGRWHNPEFSLLEWYKLDCDHFQLMEEVDVFLQTIIHAKPMLRKTYQQVFQDLCQVDPFETTVEALQACLAKFNLTGVLSEDETDPDQYLFLLMSHVIEPLLAKEERPIAVYHFPPSQASLAKIHQGKAERFEIYYRGVELANGFHELTESSAQAARFEQDQAIRQQKGLMSALADWRLLAALEHGLPACSGVALGLDRLIALALQKDSLSEILAFDFSRA